jgi:hypothetical protein
MEKYYTPEIEEFHVGFEYEYNYEEGITRVLGTNDTVDTEEVRVKYLDKEDIESLGFKLDNVHNEVKFNYLMFPYRLEHTPHNNRLDIYKWGDECDMIGYINIKNKSELKRLLKQLNIIE